jgi:hypothetical protein
VLGDNGGGMEEEMGLQRLFLDAEAEKVDTGAQGGGTIFSSSTLTHLFFLPFFQRRCKIHMVVNPVNMKFEEINSYATKTRRK